MSNQDHLKLVEAFNTYLEWIDKEIEKESDKERIFTLKMQRGIIEEILYKI
jgi:hypothetical protein